MLDIAMTCWLLLRAAGAKVRPSTRNMFENAQPNEKTKTQNANKKNTNKERQQRTRNEANADVTKSAKRSEVKCAAGAAAAEKRQRRAAAKMKMHGAKTKLTLHNAPQTPNQARTAKNDMRKPRGGENIHASAADARRVDAAATD